MLQAVQAKDRGSISRGVRLFSLLKRAHTGSEAHQLPVHCVSKIKRPSCRPPSSDNVRNT